jgi:hypothetical protein
MALSQISLGQLLALMDEAVRGRIVALARKPGTTQLVFFENNLLDSSSRGKCTVLAIGPSCTYKTLTEVEGKCLHDLPSQRQYPQYWCHAKETDAHAANWCLICKCPIRDGFCTPSYRGVHIRQWIYREDVHPPILGGERRPKKTERRH